ncbi:MAG: hypothetical protein ABIP55_01515 [Tepidisphaeraceae bacterium]
MRGSMLLLTIGLWGGLSAGGSAALTGCRNPPPPRVLVPRDSDGNPYTTYKHDDVKPLPPSATQSMKESGQPQPMLTDPAVLTPPGPPPVSQAYLEAYDRVGRPRIMVLADRPNDPQRALVPGDYDLLERVVRETLAAKGQVLVIAPSAVSEKVDRQQLSDISAGRPDALADAGGKLRADVLVQVRFAAPAGGVPAGGATDTQLTATARNTRDTAQIATAAAAVGNPPQRRQMDFAARLLAERLVDELTTAWERLAKERASTQPATKSPTQP